ncbi:hypothetical protein HanIR_Chr07g0333281 [Helianthus annuus]|nr:hypothetical protein HanIR_Chr07g0333281 [Helianthus annuus]
MSRPIRVESTCLRHTRKLWAVILVGKWVYMVIARMVCLVMLTGREKKALARKVKLI